MTASEAHMSVAKWTESAARASERCWRAMRPSVRERVKSTAIEQSSTTNGADGRLEREVMVEEDAADGFGDRIQTQEANMMPVSTKAESDSTLPWP